MKTTKFAYVLFSLALIAALVLAAIPMTPAHALSAASTSTSLSANANASVSGTHVLICRHVVRWIHGHRISVWVCHWVHKPTAS